LRVEPGGEPGSRAPVDYSLRVRRDRPAWVFYGMALMLLIVPPLVSTLRHATFEHARWSQSDHAAGNADDEEGGEDEEDE
jgi:hypothetical protein